MTPLLRSPSQLVNPLARQRFLGFGTAPGGAATFNPLSLSPLIWCDATQEAYANGDPVGQFTDWSGNSNHFVSSGTARPTFKTSGINSKAAIEADGVDDTMTRAAIGQQLDWWAFIVFQPVVMASTRCLWAVPDFPVATAGSYRMLETNSTTTLNLNQGAGAMPSNITGLSNGGRRVIRIDGHTTYIRYQGDNGTVISKTGMAGNWPTSANDGRLTNFAQRIFARGDNTQFFNVRIGEMILGSGNLTDAQNLAVWQYFSTKWGTLVPS